MRTPLTVGALYLLAIGLIAGEWIGFSLSGSSLAESRIATAVAYLGPTTTTAALTAAAVLLGSLACWDRPPESLVNFWRSVRSPRTTDVTNWLKSRLDITRHYSRGQFIASEALTPEIREAYEKAHPATKDHEDGAAEPAVEVERLATALSPLIRGEGDAIVTQLLKDAPGVFDEVDRLRSEASLRFSIFPPLVALAIYFAFAWHWTGIFLVVAPLAFATQALGLRHAAEEKALTAVLHRAVSSPTVDTVDRFIAQESPLISDVPKEELVKYESEKPQTDERSERMAQTQGIFNRALRDLLGPFDIDYTESVDGKPVAIVSTMNESSPDSFAVDKAEALAQKLGFELHVRRMP